MSLVTVRREFFHGNRAPVWNVVVRETDVFPAKFPKGFVLCSFPSKEEARFEAERYCEMTEGAVYTVSRKNYND